MTTDDQPYSDTVGAREAEEMSLDELGQKADQETEWGNDRVESRLVNAFFERAGFDVKVITQVVDSDFLAQGVAHWRKLDELKAMYSSDDWDSVGQQVFATPLLADAAIKVRPMITQIFGDARVVLRVEPDPFDGRDIWTLAVVRIPPEVDGHVTMLALTKQWHTVDNRRLASLLHLDTEYIQ